MRLPMKSDMGSYDSLNLKNKWITPAMNSQQETLIRIVYI